MENNNQLAEQPKGSINAFLKSEGVQNRIKELVKDNAAIFTTSLLQIVNSSDQLKTAEPQSILMAALTGASLGLPLNNSLGFAYIIAYKGKEKTEAQFQMGYKGYKQLAIRTGLFKYLNATDVREGEVKVNDRLTGEIEFDWNQNPEEREKKKVIGYVSYFELTTGYKSTVYMTYDQIYKHAKKYSQSFKSSNKWVSDNSRWALDFDSMALKTVTKLNLSKNAPLSVELQTAIRADQSSGVVTEDGEFEYIDNQEEELPSPADQNAALRELFERLKSEDKVPKNKWGRYTDILENEEVASYPAMLKELNAL